MAVANVTAAELAAILPPGELDLAPDDLAPAVGRRIAHFGAGIAELGLAAEVLDAWRGRLDLVRPPPQPQSLQELVGAARHALRRQRLTLDRAALDRRVAILTELRAELAP
jgi:hypothetical protein